MVKVSPFFLLCLRAELRFLFPVYFPPARVMEEELYFITARSVAPRTQRHDNSASWNAMSYAHYNVAALYNSRTMHFERAFMNCSFLIVFSIYWEKLDENSSIDLVPLNVKLQFDSLWSLLDEIIYAFYIRNNISCMYMMVWDRVKIILAKLYIDKNCFF